MTPQAHGPARHEDGLDLHDLTLAEAQEAIDLFRRHAALRVDMRTSLRRSVDHAFLDDVEIVTAATQKQATRSAQARVRLLEEEGAETYATLATRRDSSPSSTRTWVSRQRSRNKLFTVEAKGITLIPRVQLTESGDLDKAVSELLVAPLLQAGEAPWSLWSWITRPAGLLSGEIPADLVTENPTRVRHAVQRHLADLSFPAGA